jgi:kelch-like protein 20
MGNQIRSPDELLKTCQLTCRFKVFDVSAKIFLIKKDYCMKHVFQLIGCFMFIAILLSFGSCIKDISQLALGNQGVNDIGKLPSKFFENPGVLSLCAVPENLTQSISLSTLNSIGSPLTESPAAAAGSLDVAMIPDQSLTDSAIVTLIYTHNGSSFGFNHLSQARSGMGGGSVDDKIFFAGGQMLVPGSFNYGFSAVVDIFNTAFNTLPNLPKSVATLSVPRALPAVGSAGHVIAFGGGIIAGDPYANSNTVDIYNNGNNTWSTSQLSRGRGFLAAAGWGTKILFGGGEDITTTIPTDLVDIYDINSNSWTISRLSQARSHLAAASTCNKIFFAGGLLANATASDRVDIYDVPSGTWSVAQLSEPRIDLFGVAAGNRIFFGGGYKDIALNPSMTMDVYDMSSGTWSVIQLSGRRLAGAPALDRVIFNGDYQLDVFELHAGN